MTALAILLGLAIGLIVGAIGGGGAILALPVLVYVLGEPVGPASTATLVVVSLAAAIGAGSLARHGRVCWRLAFTFAVPAALGSLLGTFASRDVGAAALVLAFVPVMLVAAIATWRARGERGGRRFLPAPAARAASPSPACSSELMTGFFGVGGGFVIVPVLTLWLDVPFRRAVATSLVIICLTGLAALASHLLAGARPDVVTTALLARATGLGALAGTMVGERLPQIVLRRGFAVIVSAVAVALLVDVLVLGGPPAEAAPTDRRPLTQRKLWLVSDGSRRPTGVLITLVLAGVVFSLSQTLVVAGAAGAGGRVRRFPSAVSWVLTGFLVSASIATPIVGKLGDLYGKGRMLTAILLLFSAGGVVCALATSIEVVIAGRVLQGAGGGVFPLAFGIVRDTFPREYISGGLSIVSAIFGIGGGIGLPLSGVIVDNVNLDWLFWISMIGCPPRSPPTGSSRPRRRWRTPASTGSGALVLSCALAGVLLGVSQGSEWGWGSAANVGCILGGLVLVGVFVAIEARVEQPLIDLGVLRQPAVAATNFTAFLIGVAMFSSFLIMPQFAQAPENTGYGFGFTVTQAGLLLMPTALAQLAAGPLAAHLASASASARCSRPAPC